jgi:hypothetical protein
MPRTRILTRTPRRRTFRRLNRCVVRLNVHCTPDRWRGPDELSAALSAFRRAIHCHRRLARIAPRFFDATVIAREEYERAARLRWLQSWEPAIAKAYGHDPDPAALAALVAAPPPKPSLRTQRVLKRELAGWDHWMAIAGIALQNYRRHRPHALPKWTQLVRLIETAFELKRLGISSFEPDLEKEQAETAEYEAMLKRAYPPRPAEPPPPPTTSAPPVAVTPVRVPPPWPPPDDKRDITPFKIVIGEHGFRCLVRVDSDIP